MQGIEKQNFLFPLERVEKRGANIYHLKFQQENGEAIIKVIISLFEKHPGKIWRTVCTKTIENLHVHQLIEIFIVKDGLPLEIAPGYIKLYEIIFKEGEKGVPKDGQYLNKVYNFCYENRKNFITFKMYQNLYLGEAGLAKIKEQQ